MGCNNQCLQYQALKPKGSRYALGQKRCQICQIYLKWDGNHCPCCNYLLRSKARDLKYKEINRKVKETDDIKVQYIGQGKDPKLKLSISDEYLNTVPRLNWEQLKALEESIREDGLHEPISVNEKGVVLDGHTRYKICADNGIVLKYIVKKFPTKTDEEKYVVTSNLKRRQLTSFQMLELLQSLRFKLMKETREKTNKILSDIKKGNRGVMTDEERKKNDVEVQLSKITGIGIANVDKIHYIMKHGTEEQKEVCRTKDHQIQTVYREIVNNRHTSNAENIRNIRSFPPCPMCKGSTRFAGKCHVHKRFCCRFCSYGE